MTTSTPSVPLPAANLNLFPGVGPTSVIDSAEVSPIALAGTENASADFAGVLGLCSEPAAPQLPLVDATAIEPDSTPTPLVSEGLSPIQSGVVGLRAQNVRSLAQPAKADAAEGTNGEVGMTGRQSRPLCSRSVRTVASEDTESADSVETPLDDTAANEASNPEVPLHVLVQAFGILPLPVQSLAPLSPVSLPPSQGEDGPATEATDATTAVAQSSTLSTFPTRAALPTQLALAPQPAPEPSASGKPKVAATGDFSASLPLAPMPMSGVSAPQRMTADEPATLDAGVPDAPAEKTAAPQFRGMEHPALSDPGVLNNKFLSADNKVDATPSKGRGIVNAKSSVDMRSNLETTLPDPVSAQTRTVGQSASPEFSPASMGLSGATVRSTPAPRGEVSVQAQDAAGVVRDVVELTHEFRARERGSVEVKFNLQNDTEVSVRLALRDGNVQTTFRAASEELRAALSREWQGYSAQFSSEAQGYRVAEPVFTTAKDFSDSPQGRDANAFTGGDARQQSSSSHPENPAGPRSGSSSSARAAHSGGAASSEAARADLVPHRLNDRSFHAFA